MKQLTTLALLLATTAADSLSASLDRAGTWMPTKPQPPAAAAAGYLINDGSFELGPPPASAWTELANPPCERIGDFSSVWSVTAFDGTHDYWAGGYCDGRSGKVPVNSSVTQSIPIPPNSPFLQFAYIAYRPDADDVPNDGDHAYVAVNGVEVWTLPLVQASDTYPSWAHVVDIDLSAYSDQTVSFSIGGVSVGDLTGNARIDYIQVIGDLGPVEASTWGRLKALYR